MARDCKRNWVNIDATAKNILVLVNKSLTERKGNLTLCEVVVVGSLIVIAVLVVIVWHYAYVYYVLSFV